ncbi:MAG: valine--tRNA ligase [Rhabdochlamydiaceae bacterium]|nr:valine--tRNA ligase [Rhabdochlamydiaceae bacterium]
MSESSLDQQIPKAYDPKGVEEKLYCFWEKGGFFKADPHSVKPAYTISIPPPNVTGVLHMGHALVNTLQDVLIRWKRMSGFEALWVPGTDHAGIATQTVVERQLIASENKRRKDFSREEFLSHVWKWKEQSQSKILGQIKRLGSSCDWSRLAFTMDEKRNRAVRTCFKKMFDAGFIYRGDYLVNWDPITQTALADDEVEYEERASFLWYIRYPLEDHSGDVIIATTRPETLLGDTAVAVSPSDDRYQDLIGKQLKLPLMNRTIPIIADRLVDPTFGTGAVKVTPAHDPNDYEMGLTHRLPFINILTADGKINENGGPYTGLSTQEAREAVVADLKTKGFLVKQDPHKNRVGVSYRSKAVIEPYLSKQWFIRMSDFKGPLRSAVETKRVRLIPENWENTYFHWIDNLRDWCISRQLWWGHRIPIWYRKDNPEVMICYDGEGLPPEVDENPDAWTQDEDVLDTWFSSSLWPFSILGWPEQTEDLNKFYPNATLITGHDILFFWVARMIAMGEYVLGQVPFKETFLHGLIYGKSYWRHNADGSIAYASSEERLNFDLGKPIPPEVHSKWEKMSKSKGNIIDPIEIIDAYGADAMRMALCSSATHARQIDLDRRRFEEFKNFTNKVWNGARFVLMNLDTLNAKSFASGLSLEQLGLEDKWILSLLNRTIRDVTTHLTDYAFDRAAMTAYEFFWKEFCAYYVELVKPVLFGKIGTSEDRELKQKLLTIVLCSVIRLLHPMAPFITEELFQTFKSKFSGETSSADPYTRETLLALNAPACIVAPYPLAILADIDPKIEETFAFIDEVIYAVRNIRAEMQLPPNIATDLTIIAPKTEPQRQLVEAHSNLVQALVRIHAIRFEEIEHSYPFSANALVGNLKLIIPLPQELREKEKVRLVKEQEKLIQQENTLRGQLSNTGFLEKAPPQLVEKLKSSLAQAEKELSDVMQKLKEWETTT